MLQIKNLQVKVDGRIILDRFSLDVKAGETHAIMGPNGSGKSTLCFALLGHPGYEISSGKIVFKGKNILKLSTDERARLGLFLGFQYPQEVGGITLGNFLRQAVNLRNKARSSGKKKEIGLAEFFPVAGQLLDCVGLGEKFIGRGVNQGFSGGEKKRVEIAQMAALKPDLAILDGPDSGLDLDSLKLTARAISNIKKDNRMGLIVITHYRRLLKHLKADHVHIMIGGRLVKSGGRELLTRLDRDGYQSFKS